MDLNKIEELLDTPLEQLIPNTIITHESFVDNSKQEISQLHRQVVTELHASYMIGGSYLTLEQLKLKVDELGMCSPVGLEDLFKKVNVTLEKRDLPPFSVKFLVRKSQYDPDFITACHVLADVSDRRPVSSKLKSIGVSTNKWNNFLKLKKNHDYWTSILDNLMDKNVWNEGRIALAKNVAEGDLPSIKYFNELTGKFVQQRDFDPRILGVLMTSVLDIIMRHVDPQTARVIADEMDQAAILTLSGIIPVASIERSN